MVILLNSIGTLKVEAGACWTVYSSLKIPVEHVSKSGPGVESSNLK
jgi:hypothetical protein